MSYQVLGSFWFLGFAIVLAMFLSVLGLWLVRKKFGFEVLAGHHEVASALLTVVGTLYAVVLGFIVVDSLSTFQEARANVGQESNALHDVFRLASGLQMSSQQGIRQLCLNYARIMIDQEWRAMQQGRGAIESHVVLDRLWHQIVHYSPVGAGEQNVQSALLTEMQRLNDARHTRMVAANPSENPAIWTVMIFGGMIVIVFTYFFGLRNIKVQALMTSLIALILGLNLALIESFSTPFAGDVCVTPVPFQLNIENFQSEIVEAESQSAPAARQH